MPSRSTNTRFLPIVLVLLLILVLEFAGSSAIPVPLDPGALVHDSLATNDLIATRSERFKLPPRPSVFFVERMTLVRFLPFLVLAFVSCDLRPLVAAPASPVGARIVSENGYEGCIELANATTRVVLEPNLGGRVLHYQLNGIEALYQDPSHDGRTYDPAGTDRLHPPGGRFDFGPEFTVPKHPGLFLGKWTAEITSNRSARLTSARDEASGVQLIREFSLDARGPHLACTQSILNIGKVTLRYCHWGRTFADTGGICLVPLNPASRYPKGYALYTSGDVINFRPADEPNLRVREGLLEIIGVPSAPKVAIDASEGWLAHLGKNNLLFVKKFSVFTNRPYGELAANSVAFYYREAMAELEPIGPIQEIAPGQRSSFTEDWWLHEFAFPADLTPDLKAVRALVTRSANLR